MKKANNDNLLYIAIVLSLTFLVFVGTVLMYEEKIDELESIINELKELY